MTWADEVEITLEDDEGDERRSPVFSISLSTEQLNAAIERARDSFHRLSGVFFASDIEITRDEMEGEIRNDIEDDDNWYDAVPDVGSGSAVAFNIGSEWVSSITLSSEDLQDVENWTEQFYNEAREERGRARDRSKNLFVNALTDDEREEFLDFKSVTIVGSNGGRYRIHCSRHTQNISDRDSVYCISIRDSVPLYDHLLAQKLLIETNEKRFLEIANKWSSPS